MLNTLWVSRWLTGGLLVCCLLSYPILVSAQAATATLHGTVAESEGGLVSGARISIGLQGSEVSPHMVTTASDGEYKVTALEPGVYQLKVETAGYKTIVVNRLQLAGGDNQELKFTLEAGSPEEIITIDLGEQVPVLSNCEIRDQ